VTGVSNGAARPTASNLNFVAGQSTPNLTIAKVGAGGMVSLFNSARSTHLIADVVGWIPDSQENTQSAWQGTYTCSQGLTALTLE